MKRWVGLSLLAVIAVASVRAEPIWEGDWSKIRRYGHGQDRDLFTEEQLAYIDDNIAYLTCEKIHGTDVFSGGNLDQAAMYTADQLQHTKVLLYLQAYYAFGRWQAEVAADYSNTNLFIYDGGMTDYAFNQGTVEGREFWASISDNCVNTSKVVGTYVDAIGKISTHGHSDWLPEFRKTLSQLDGLTIYNGPPSDLLDDSEGCMREDFIEGNIENMRTYLDLFLQVPDEEYMMLNSFHPDYQFALAGFLIIAHDKSFLRLYPDGGNNWNDVLWHCDEYDNPLGPPKGKGVRTGDWTYERSFEYADVWLDLEHTNSTITWYEAPVAHWTMEDGSGTTVSDVSGNGFDGTLSGGTWVSGVNGGGALEFNGSASLDTVSIPADLFNSVSNEITVAMWVKGDAAEQPRDDSVFEAVDSSGNPLFNIHLPLADSQVVWSAGGNSITNAATEADFEGQWNHWAFTKSATNGTMNIYLNGALWHSGTENTTMMTGVVANACFGSAVGAGYYEGVLDDVRIYNRALSETEISAFAQERPVADPISVSMDEDRGSVAITLSGLDADGYTSSALTYTVGTEPAYGTVSGIAPDLIYTPETNFFGSDRFFYIVSADGTNSYAAEVSITVNAIDDVPEASAQHVACTKNEPTSIELVGTDGDGDSLTYTVVSDPAHGTLSGTAPNLIYTPDAGYLGGDRFSFAVNDGVYDSAPATVSIFVSPIITYAVTYSDSDSIPTVSNEDLAQTYYLSSSATGGNEVATEHAELFNGLVGSAANNTSEDGVVTMDSSNTFTVEFDTSVNTEGYCITGIDSYFGWATNSGGRANQGYEIILTFVDGTTGTLIGPEHWAPNAPTTTYWTAVSFSPASGDIMAEGVSAVTFNITEDANPGGVVIAREVDILGYPPIVPLDPPIAEWALDDGSGTVVADRSGNGFDGTLTNGTWVGGFDDGALEFNGSDSSVTLPVEAFASISNAITISMWVYGGDNQPRKDSVFYAVNAEGKQVLNIHLPWDNGSVYWDAGQDGGIDRINKGASLSEYMGQWNHWVFTKNAATGGMAIYLNGESWLSETGKTKSMAGISAAALGSQNGALSYEGTIDDVCVYNYALTDAQVSALYFSYEHYSSWAAGYGLSGDDALRTADVENGGLGDGYNNLAEYALGMNPTNSDAATAVKVESVLDGGTNWFELVHKRLTNYEAQGLHYLLVDLTNLVDSVTFTNTQDQVLVGAPVDGYEPVTNRYTADEPVKFITLDILMD